MAVDLVAVLVVVVEGVVEVVEVLAAVLAAVTRNLLEEDLVVVLEAVVVRNHQVVGSEVVLEGMMMQLVVVALVAVAVAVMVTIHAESVNNLGILLETVLTNLNEMTSAGVVNRVDILPRIVTRNQF